MVFSQSLEHLQNWSFDVCQSKLLQFPGGKYMGNFRNVLCWEESGNVGGSSRQFLNQYDSSIASKMSEWSVQNQGPRGRFSNLRQSRNWILGAWIMQTSFYQILTWKLDVVFSRLFKAYFHDCIFDDFGSKVLGSAHRIYLWEIWKHQNVEIGEESWKLGVPIVESFIHAIQTCQTFRGKVKNRAPRGEFSKLR